MSRHLYIAGVDRRADLERGSLRIEQALTYQIDTCSFSVKGEQPTEGEEVVVEDDELGRLFAGIIVKVELGRTFPDKSIKVWNVDCDDYTALLDRRLVVESYENMSASDIFLDIARKYCSDFTVNGVRPGAPVVEATGTEFEYKRPSECFRWLCDYVGWHWQPDYYKDLHFFSAEELASPAPMALRPGGKFRFGKHAIDTQGLRNRVYVRGGTMLSDPQVVRWKADGAARHWVLPWGPHEVSLTVGEVPMTIGVENLHDEADFDYMMSFSEKYIRCSSQTSTPAEGTTMSLTARQDIPVITMVEDYVSQAAIAKVQGGDGVYEHVIDDDSLTSIAAAEAAGMSDLREHANPRVKGSFETEYAKPPELTPTTLSYGEDFGQGDLDGVVGGAEGLGLRVKNFMAETEPFWSSLSGWGSWQLLGAGDGFNRICRFSNSSTHNPLWHVNIPITGGKSYTFRAWVRKEGNGGIGAFYIRDNTGADNNLGSIPVDDEWSYWEVSFISDVAATHLIRASIQMNAIDSNTILEVADWEVIEDDGALEPSGTRISPPIDLASIGTAKTSAISWEATIPTGTSLTIETALSIDNGQTWGEWQEATNGGNIPGIMVGMDLTGCRLKTRATLETTDTGITPVLNSLTISLTGEKLESRNWRPGQIVTIQLPDRGIEGEYLIQKETITPATPDLWTFRVEYGGRLLGIADFLKALVSAQQKKRHIEPTQNVQKYVYGEETLRVSDELFTATRALPYICGDADAVCGLVVVSNG